MVSLVVAVLVLCGALLFASLTALGTEAEGEVRQLVAAVRARWEQHDFHRECAREPRSAGNAFDAYREAIALVAALPPELIARAEQVVNDYRRSMNALELHEGAANAYRLIDATNEFIAATSPWALAKDPSKATHLSQVLFDSAEAIRLADVFTRCRE